MLWSLQTPVEVPPWYGSWSCYGPWYGSWYGPWYGFKPCYGPWYEIVKILSSLWTSHRSDQEVIVNQPQTTKVKVKATEGADLTDQKQKNL